MHTRLIVGAILLAVASMPAPAAAETYPYDHMHFAVPDQAKAVDWYMANFGAKRGDAPDRVVVGRTIFVFLKSDTAKPSTGSVIDHIGFSVPDLDSKITALQSAGAKVVSAARDIPGLFKIAFIEDPWGIKIELVQDPETPGFHHIHLRVADPDASLKWYVDTFGGERAKLKGRLDAVKYTNPNVWLLAQKGHDGVPSQGRAIDHLGWAVQNVDAKVADLKAKGANPTEPRPVRHLKVAFVDGPGGVRIEMVQGRKAEELEGK